MDISPEDQARFWSRVRFSEGCWLWTAGLNRPNGYGVIQVNGKNFRAHRLSFLMTTGPIPEGMLVCHKCDNPRCVRPSHLFVGSHRDNLRDAIRKGRAVPPPLNGRSLSGEEIQQAIEMAKKKATFRDIAKHLGVSETTVGRCLRDRGILPPPNGKLSAEHHEYIVRRFESGAAIRAIARELSVTPMAVKHHLKKAGVYHVAS